MQGNPSELTEKGMPEPARHATNIRDRESFILANGPSMKKGKKKTKIQESGIGVRGWDANGGHS
jgi:hypothetical protein